MIDTNFKEKLDKLLVEGHIDIDEYKHMINSYNTHNDLNNKTTKKSNKLIIIFVIILLIIYSSFVAYKKMKIREEQQQIGQYEYELNNLIHQGQLLNNP